MIQLLFQKKPVLRNCFTNSVRRNAMDKGLQLNTNQDIKLLDKPYRKLLCNNNADIYFAVGYIGKKKSEEQDALKRIVRYLKGTQCKEFVFQSNPGSDQITGYKNAEG
ncbi:hypothetical protein ACFFRR_007717 [Megaselia abdita]